VSEGIFTSDLSLDEVLLIEEMGFEPVDLVMGTSYFHIGWQSSGWGSQELDVLTHGMSEARHMAMRRVNAQLQQLGADGIVGMRLTVEHHHHTANFVAIGTAIRRTDGRGQDWRVNGRPFTSALSGQDLHTLARAGFRPCALVMGNCVYQVEYQGLLTWFRNRNVNVEQANFTTALYDARELAMGRMQAEAEAAGANGIVGVKVHEGTYSWGSHVIEFMAIGTAISPMGTLDPKVAVTFDLG
jgi:uncharacterized protein YbjQ (UPF0145 family)